MRIKIKTVNVYGIEKDWEFNSIEPILKNWYADDSKEFPSGDDKVVGRIFICDGKEIHANYFEDVINSLQELYWRGI